MISLRDLEFIASLARRKHFARAAEDCGVSQPAFSMRIRKLEEKLDTPIVKRGNRFQGFTAEGEALVRHARTIVEDVKILEQEFRSAKGEITGKLVIGAVPTAVIFAARTVKALRTKHPGIKVSIQTATSLAIQQGLENGLYEAGITYGEGVSHDLLRVEELYKETYLLLVPTHLAPRLKGEATWTEAAQLPLTLLEPGMQNRRILDKVFDDLGLLPEVSVETGGFIAAMVLAAEGMSATVVPKHLIEALGTPEGTVALPLAAPVLEKNVSIVTPLRDPNLPTVEALRRALLKK
ncbi:transcriptional regulator, LysR family [Roseovarius marisflavi]|uniref:Transcriptional regulator, LysR family n=1 Tax=Roseovarius marisflavi TaxID=1054996 RepID=A0A1M7CKG0_9RHOB|nr:LysR family transcriptional regulator [Roseovarius marisflavi]SHL67741.1 transcriptional regulator, LysR family [Roseovarius marisflavi]